MHAYLLIGGQNESIEKKVEEIVSKHNARKLEFNLSTIDDARELIHFATLASSTPQVAVVSGIDEASKEAQNAFLKALEEPPKNLYYVLVVKDETNLAPTILSRTKAILLENSRQISNPMLVNEFLKADLSTRLSKISKMKDRGEVTSFLEDLIIRSHELVIEGKKGSDTLAESLLECLKAIKMNGNIQLHLTNLVSKIDKYEF